MGLDASVMCNCLRDGRTTKPPFPVEWLEIDGEGLLTLVSEHDTDDRWHKLYNWQKSCCEHERMNHVSTAIANWSGYRVFQQALGDLGWDKFPVLHAELPSLNGGLTSAEKSKVALTELDTFAGSVVIGEKTVLVNSCTNEEIQERVAAYEGVFILSGSAGVDVGLDVSEVVATDRATGVDFFRARRMRQFKSDDTPIADDDDEIIWENLDTGERYKARLAIPGKLIPWDDGEYQNSDGRVRQEYPSKLHVEVRPMRAEQFLNITRRLQSVFSASAETGTPVRWC